MKIAWDDSLSVNNTEIDNQHKMLISIIQSLQQNNDRTIVSKCLDDLINYIGVHFKDEEKHMWFCNYKDFESHKKLHKDFVVEINHLINEFDRRATDKERILEFLIDWFINHIKMADKLYAVKS
jgi:hemerythrin-like metal-binding protein